MHRSLFAIILIFCLVPPVASQAQINKETTIVKKNYIRSICGEDHTKKELIELLSSIAPEKEVSDQNVIELQQLYPISQEDILLLIETLREDGSWPDINYADTKRSGWEPKIHAEKMLKLAKYYYQQKETAHPDAIKRIKTAIHQSMNFWFTQKLVCKNWWYNQIGIPRTLGPVFLIIEDELSEMEKQQAIEVMMHAKFGMTGQNKVWLAGNVLMRALLQNDYELVKAARNAISSEITLGQKEGIKNDWSFHQHGPQQQFGNYGLSFIGNMSFYSELFAGTSLAFSTEQQQILTSLLLKGYQWILWKGHFEVNALNRQLFKNVDIDKAFSLLFAAHALIENSTPQERKEIERLIDWNFRSPQIPNTFVGTKHFDESDYTIHRTPQWMASVRMASNRITGTELVNEDNLKGYYMADGALYTYFRGDEYHNIFPFWDWRKIPGITTYGSNAPIPNPNQQDARNHSSCVAGATYNHTGITTMQLNRNKLKANKSWIFTDEYVLCMGSNIHADSTATIQTSIDQRFSKGKVWSSKNERFFHDNTGYIILQADTCIASTEERLGQWNDFMGLYKPEIVKNELFTLYLKHRTDVPASYIYLILPASAQQQVSRFDTRSIHVVRNDKEAQAVIIKDLCYVSAYQPTRIQIDKQSPLHIAEPGTYIVRVKDGQFVARKPFSSL